MNTRYSDRIFGTQVSVAGLDDPAGALRWLRRAETVLSRFDPASDLSRLNRERSTVCDPILIELLLAATAWHERTEGVVTPFLGRVIVANGYDRDFAALPREPSDSLPESGTQLDQVSTGPDQRALSEDAELVIDVQQRRVGLPAGVDLDVGGFAKGWAADQVRRRDNSRRGLVDVGGDLTAWSAGTPWRVGIEGTDQVLEVTDGAMATSSTRHRRWWHGEREVHHLLDSSRGRPTESDCIQATVITRDALTAEVAAKAALLSGIDAAPQVLAQLVPGSWWALSATDGRLTHNLPPLTAAARARRHTQGIGSSFPVPIMSRGRHCA